MNKLSGIKVCIWDFDGTLFAPNPNLTKDIIEADYRVVINHTGWSRKKTIEEFHKIFKVKTPSSTETAAILSNIPVSQAAIECEDFKDRIKYLSRDEKLIDMFKTLSGYTHYILANGSVEKIVPGLSVLGIPKETFTEIVTSEIVGFNKPNPAGFLYVMKKTGFQPEQHLMIGDRDAVDLAPAEKLGIRTCLVWEASKSALADFTLPTVYDVVKILT